MARAWENARAQGAALGIARSQLYPTLTAVALSGVDREEIPLGTRFYRHTVPAEQVARIDRENRAARGAALARSGPAP